MILNAVEYFNEGLEYENIVNVVNTIFVTLYGLESLFKIIGLRLHFFRDYWNIFDLLINILSIICKFFMKRFNFDVNIGILMYLYLFKMAH